MVQKKATSKKKIKRVVSDGIAHVCSTFNNTVVYFEHRLYKGI